MKKIFILLLLIVAGVLFLSGCEKANRHNIVDKTTVSVAVREPLQTENLQDSIKLDSLVEEKK